MDFIIKDKIIKLDKASLGGKKVVSINSGYVANFIFDEEWDGLIKTVRFINDGEFVDVVLPETNTCKIPLEILRSGTLEVGVFAGDLTTTTTAKVNVLASVLEDTYEPADPISPPSGGTVFSVNGKQGFVVLTAEDVGALTAEDLQSAIEEALAIAKESGEFKGDPGVPGKDGVDGKDGLDGQPGEKGDPGYTPQKGIDYFDGKDGKDGVDGQDGQPGKDGEKGNPGEPGYTPVKGTDYFTPDDINEIVNSVLAQFVDASEVGM